MIKETIVPEHKIVTRICDYCGKEITDYSHTSLSKDGEPVKHFHDMHAGGALGDVDITCLEKWKLERRK